MSIYVIKSRLEKELEKIERELALNQVDILQYTNLNNTQILNIQQSKLKKEIWEKSKEVTETVIQLIEQIILHYNLIQLKIQNIQILLIEASVEITQIRRDEIMSLVMSDLNAIDTIIDQTMYNDTRLLQSNIIAVNVGETPFFNIVTKLDIAPTYDTNELITYKLNSVSTNSLGINGLLINDINETINSKELVDTAYDNILKYKLELTSLNKTLESVQENQDIHILYYNNWYNKLTEVDTSELTKRKTHITSLLNNINTIIKNSTVLPVDSLPFIDL